MIKSFRSKRIRYRYITAEDIIMGAHKLPIKNFTKYKNGYASTAMAFDIETTSYHSEKYDKDLATMYIWQLGLDGMCIIGRTWYEFKKVIDLIADYFDARGTKVYCWIQNFSFEFQFCKSVLPWNETKGGYADIFAKDNRTILYAKYRCIEFRDSLALTAMGLAKYQKNFNLKVGKLAGDLDYSVSRHYMTPIGKNGITNAELAYCINDVMVLNEWHKSYIVPHFLDQEKNIPLTSTGLVRSDMKDEFNLMTKEEKKKMRSWLSNSQPSEQIYKIWRNYLFRGGLTHANTVRCNYLLEEPFDSYDLKSAHPSAMLQRKFPGKFCRRNEKAFDKCLKQAVDGTYAFWGIFVFYNIRAEGWHCLESKSKLIEHSEDAYFENGRLAYADYIKVALTDIDWFNYMDMYEWSHYECRMLYQAKYSYLPDYVRKTVIKYFIQKETLPKDSPEYMLAKRKLNSCFGMAATGLPEREIVLNKNTNTLELSPQSKTYEELTKWLIMLPQWAIYTAAYTRRAICKSIKACGVDSIYYDTDSNKIANPSKYEGWFDSYNKHVEDINKTMEVYDYDREKLLRIGCYEKEYTGQKYRVLGAKRYMVEYDGEVQVTVAGMVKGSYEAYCKKVGWDMWEHFTDKLELPASDSWKKTTIYYDQPFDDELTDFRGETVSIHEGSSVAIIDIPFSMSVEQEFISRIELLRQQRERMIAKGGFIG